MTAAQQEDQLGITHPEKAAMLVNRLHGQPLVSVRLKFRAEPRPARNGQHSSPEELQASALGFLRLRFDGVGYEPVDRLGSRKNGALTGAPVVKHRQKFVRRAHLERPQFLLCHAPFSSVCVDI
jgi:hypothetical protein